MALMSIPAYAKHIFFSVLFIIATVNFTRTTLNIIESSRRLEELKNQVSTLEEDKKSLQSDIAYKSSDFFVEAEARNKLGMALPDEKVFVSENILGLATTSNETNKELSALQVWLNVFRSGFDNATAL